MFTKLKKIMEINMKIISTINFKGGVGKTTFSLLLSKYLSQIKNKKVLLIDIDPQKNLSYSILYDSNKKHLIEKHKKWYESYEKKGQNLVYCLKYYFKKDIWQKMDLSKSYIKINSNLSFIPAVTNLYWFEILNKRNIRVDNFIKDLSKKISLYANDIDFVIVDCPPVINYLTISSMKSSDNIFIPTNPHKYSSEALKVTFEVIKKLKIPPSTDLNIFLNKARCFNLSLSKESEAFINECKSIIDSQIIPHKVTFLEKYIIELRSYSRINLYKKIPYELKEDFFDWLEL